MACHIRWQARLSNPDLKSHIDGESNNAQSHPPKLVNPITHNLRLPDRVDRTEKREIQQSSLVHTFSSIVNIVAEPVVTIFQNVAWVEGMNDRATFNPNLEEAGFSSEPHALRETREQIVATGCNAALTVNDNVWRKGLDRFCDGSKVVLAGHSA
jgi:hypothetical protein